MFLSQTCPQCKSNSLILNKMRPTLCDMVGCRRSRSLDQGVALEAVNLLLFVIWYYHILYILLRTVIMHALDELQWFHVDIICNDWHPYLHPKLCRKDAFMSSSSGGSKMSAQESLGQLTRHHTL